MLPIVVAIWGVCFATLFAAAASDLARRIIPNRLVLVIAAGGVGLRLLSDPARVWISIASAAALLVGFGELARNGFIGGGDAKLISAVTLLVQPADIVMLLCDIALAGGLLSLFYLAVDRVRLSGRDAKRRAARTATRVKAIPYGLAVLGGVMFFSIAEATRCFYATSCSL